MHGRGGTQKERESFYPGSDGGAARLVRTDVASRIAAKTASQTGKSMSFQHLNATVQARRADVRHVLPLKWVSLHCVWGVT